jgi:type III restriction enzyme
VSAKGEVETSVLDQGPGFVNQLHQHVFDYEVGGEWSFDELVVWLDRKIDHSDITPEESWVYIRKALNGLMGMFSIKDMQVLVSDRFRLRDAVAERIDEHRKDERRFAFESFLLPTSPLILDTSRGVDFRKMVYEPSWKYEGAFQFKKHYFGPKPGELRDGEEGQCAQFIDGLPEVRFWVRNLQRKRSSFRLQTSKDWFYPDFVCRLDDDRLLVVEYKGKFLYDTPDSEEKRLIGQAWESRSNGRCLFVMPTDRGFSVITAKIHAGLPSPDTFRLT